MRSRMLVISTMLAMFTSAAPLGFAESKSTRRSSVSVENGFVVNNRAGYYFTLPKGWTLDEGSTSERLTVHHAGSGATFSVSCDHAHGANPTMVYMSFIWSFESPDNNWLSFGKGDTKLGGRPATGIRGTRVRDGKKMKELAWVALIGEYAYMVLSQVVLDQFEPRAPEIDLMFTSFTWGTPAGSP